MSDVNRSYLEYLEERLKFRLKVERTIGDISTYLVFSSNFENAIEYFLSELADLFRIYMVDGILVCLFDEPVNDQILVLSWNSSRANNRKLDFNNFPIDNDSWLVNEVQNGHEIFLSNKYNFPIGAGLEKRFIEGNKIESLIAFPIFTPEYIAGALIVITIDVTTIWPEEDLRTLRLFADILGTAIFRKKTEETLSKSRDYLKSQVKRKTKDLATEKQRVELILNTIKDGIIVLDEDGKVTIVNSTAKNIYQRIFNKPLTIGTNLVLSIHHIFFSAIRELFISRSTREITIEPCKGLHLQIVTVKSGFTSLGIIIEMRDITPFVEFDNMRKRFVSTVSHELRTPITVISQSISNYEKYKDKLSESTIQRLMEAISRNANLLKELIEDLLLISRIDERRLKFHWKEFEVIDVLNEVIAQLEPRAKAKAIELKFNIQEGVPKLIGDPKRIAQIFRIILDNGIKYSNEKGVVKIEILNSSPIEHNPNSNGGVIIKISDNGLGISEEDLPKLFNRFFRSEKVSHIPGTGLGLGIAKDLVKMHHGEIFVESKVNSGTTVTIILPKLDKNEMTKPLEQES